MLTFPQLVVSMWCVPLFLFILLPMAVLAGRLLAGAFMPRDRAARDREPAMARAGDAKTPAEHAMAPIDKRHHPRFRIAGMSADVSDGTQLCTGLTCNISRAGIGILDVPEKFFQTSGNLSVVISGREKIFRMSVRPKWYFANDRRHRLGGELLHPPAGWADFIEHYERIFSGLGKNAPQQAASAVAHG